MVTRTRADRTIVPGLYLDAWEYDGRQFPNDIGHNPRLRTSSVITDKFGRHAQVSSVGELIMGAREDYINVNFQYGVSTYDVVDGGVASGTGSIGQDGSLATVSTGTGVGVATLESKDAVRYRSGHESYCSPSVIFATPEENVNQYAGFLNGSDGICIGYQGLTPGIWFIEGGNFNFIPQSDWNIDKLDGTGQSGYELDFQTGQVLSLKFVWHGFKNITVEMFDDIDNPLPVHRLKFVNSATEPHLENPNLPVTIKIERTSGTGSNLTMKSSSWRAGVISGGKEDNSADRWFGTESINHTVTANTNANVIAVRSKTTFQGKLNHILTRMGLIDFINETNKTLLFYGNKGGTLTGNGAWTSVDVENSVLEYSIGGTVTGGTRGPSAPVNAGAQRTREVLDRNIRLYPGETFIFEVPIPNNVSGTVTVVAAWVEGH